MVGRLFGSFYYRALEGDLNRPDFIMANATRKGWTRAIRIFVLGCASYAHPRLAADNYLIIKTQRFHRGAVNDGGTTGEPNDLPDPRSEGHRVLHARRRPSRRLDVRA